jgi:creatinine amidohydrolase
MRAEDLTWREYHTAVATRIVVLPIGAVDAHGPHLPLSTDTILSTYMTRALQSQMDILVLPAVNYGKKTDPPASGGVFPAAISLRPSTFFNVVLDVLRACYRHGGRRFVILNAHMVNVSTAREACDQFIEDAPDARVMVASWWDLVSEDSRNEIARETGVGRHEDHHAAMVETSLTMYAAPNLVRNELLADDSISRRARYLILPVPDDLRTRSGIVYRASRASRSIGERLMTEIVANLVKAVKLEMTSG